MIVFRFYLIGEIHPKVISSSLCDIPQYHIQYLNIVIVQMCLNSSQGFFHGTSFCGRRKSYKRPPPHSSLTLFLSFSPPFSEGCFEKRHMREEREKRTWSTPLVLYMHLSVSHISRKKHVSGRIYYTIPTDFLV